MLFNSFEFLLFFPIVTILYFILPYNWRWFLLLSASCFFYMFFKPIYILILGFTIVVDYFAGILLENETDKKRKKLFLIMSLFVNIGILAVFKYYNFINSNITSIASIFGLTNKIPYLNILLPIGLSFHTFQAMSYTIEVYRGHQKAERNFGIYSLYVMFYPQLVAGPIERPQNLLHQFYEKHDFSYENFIEGSRLIIWGLFKKAVIADRLAMIVEPIYNNPTEYSATALAIASFFFCFQVYCDFAGYSDIAIGSARVMGFKLMTNFNRPFHAQSIGEFWKRWHISLSSWFKDYLYISLGGNKVSPIRRNFNLFIVFVVSGLWHGARWNYVIWGALHGIFVVLENYLFNFRNIVAKKIGIASIRWLNSLLNRIMCFLLFAFALIVFRANSLKEAYYILCKIMGIFHEWYYAIIHKKDIFKYYLPTFSAVSIVGCFCLIIFLEIMNNLQGEGNISAFVNKQPIIIRWILFVVAFYIIYFQGIFYNRQFIYFQF